MLFHQKNNKNLCIISICPSSSFIVILFIALLISCVANSQSSGDSTINTKAIFNTTDVKADSDTCALITRFQKIEQELNSIRNDNLDAYKSLLQFTSILISSIGLIMTIVFGILVTQGIRLLRDVKTQVRTDIEDFRKTELKLSESLKEAKNEADCLRFAEKETREKLISEAINITETGKREIGDLLSEQKGKMKESINSVIERFIEIFSDRATCKRFEVIRSKAFFYLGDETEKIRSLQYIGSLGGAEDIVFLDKVMNDTKESAEVRLAAQKAKTMIEQRKPTS